MRTHRHDEANSCFFCNFVNTSNKFHKCYQRKQEIALKPDRKIYKSAESIIV